MVAQKTNGGGAIDMEIDIEAREKFIKTCYDMARFYETHPYAPVPDDETVNIYIMSKEEMFNTAKSIGACKKHMDTNYFELVKDFGAFKLKFFTYRNQVCKAVVVGKKTIPEHVIPASEERVIPAHEEDVVEWHCPDSLLEGMQREGA
jgi:hypothetical protein